MLNVWLEQPGVKKMISDAWKSEEGPGWKSYTIQRKLSSVRVKLAQWNKQSDGDFKLGLMNARKEWERLSLLQDERGLSEEESLKKLAIQRRIWQLEQQEEKIWRQKSRIAWLKEGHLNTKFFHRSASWRYNKNRISGILVDELWVEDPELIKQAACKYFSSIFGKSDSCIWTLEGVNFATVSDSQREFLESQISREEVLGALKSCDGNKAPGPDGFNMNFFKRLWFTVEEVMGFIQEFCDNRRLPKGINRTYIALIPKSASPQSFSDFRPISLLNSSYKILSKCLANRLSTVLPYLISPTQTAFLANRNIMDGIMVINELIHALKTEGRSALVIKLDFWKAYDSVSWEYLELIQRSMGFGCKWIDWMRPCYSSASMDVLINGSPSKEFPMKRGLRQGDHLSPFLFLLAAEGLSRIIDKVAGEGLINGVEWEKGGEKMTHLQFADDTVLFCQANLEEIQRLKMILYGFEGCSGLKINFSKSMCYGIGLKEEETQSFARVLGCPVGSFPMKYLGLQVGVNPSRVSTWAPILQKFKDKLASWKSVNLSMAGILVLIKAALCNMPLYYASIYKIPIIVAQEMEKIQRQFLWGGMEGRKKIHYVKWATITKSRKFGGLGVQALREKNMALLTKWWWNLISGRGGLWRRMVLEKYAIKGAHVPGEVSLKTRKLSSCWKNIINAVKGNDEIGAAFREGLKLRLGRGNEIKFWDDVWAGVSSFKDQYPRLHILAENPQAVVGEMGVWENGVWLWKLRFRRALYQWEEVQKSELMEGLRHLQIKERMDDRVVWTFSADGIYSMSSLMRTALAIKAKKHNWESMPFKLWCGAAPPKVEMLIWRIFFQSLPTKLALYSRRVLNREEDLTCVLCEEERESSDHLLIHCRWSWELWTKGLMWWGSTWVAPQNARCLLESWGLGGASKSSKRLGKILCYATLWSI
ncbi:hypothetical protein QQ045_013414 [Rhodiola kirilowii]